MAKKILVFAHMMKTAGTSLSKQLIGHFGRRMHMVPGGLKIDHCYYKKQELLADLQKLNNKVSIISGHPMRPHINFGLIEKDMLWFTFLRNPEQRFVSHYLHDYKWSNNFSMKRYAAMKEKSIVEWEHMENNSNYQTKFLAGEANFDKAIEILEKKMSWVGCTEEFEDSMHSFKQYFDLNRLYFDVSRTNTSLADQEMKYHVKDQFSAFIADQNQIDTKLYDYFKETIWPRFKLSDTKSLNRKGKSTFSRTLNMLDFQITRQLKFNTTEINLKNLKRFYNRWYKK